jgi:hypothetical protein
VEKQKGLHCSSPLIFWRPQRDSNPRYRLESGFWPFFVNGLLATVPAKPIDFTAENAILPIPAILSKSA